MVFNNNLLIFISWKKKKPADGNRLNIFAFWEFQIKSWKVHARCVLVTEAQEKTPGSERSH